MPRSLRFHQDLSPEQLHAQLRTEHATLEVRLGQLDRLKSLSPEEHYEMQVIKKRKLFIKDRLGDPPR